MRKLSLLFVCILTIASCEKDALTEEVLIEETTQNLDDLARQGNNSAKSEKIAVCHNKGNIIYINENAVSAHIAHGDAVDMDGDGYFDIENDCSDGVDLDDNDPDVTESISIEYEFNGFSYESEVCALGKVGDRYYVGLLPVPTGIEYSINGILGYDPFGPYGYDSSFIRNAISNNYYEFANWYYFGGTGMSMEIGQSMTIENGNAIYNGEYATITLVSVDELSGTTQMRLEVYFYYILDGENHPIHSIIHLDYNVAQFIDGWVSDCGEEEEEQGGEEGGEEW